jgi:hypothetical protein
VLINLANPAPAPVPVPVPEPDLVGSEIRFRPDLKKLNPVHPYKICSYNVNGLLLDSKECIRDLGILVDNNLNFTEHIKLVKTRCFRIINLFFRFFHVKDQEFYCRLYKIYVLPLLSYGIPIYFTNAKNCMSNVENIQKYFTRRLFHKIHGKTPRPHYSDRLKLFHLHSLDSYCILLNLTYCFCIKYFMTWSIRLLNLLWVHVNWLVSSFNLPYRESTEIHSFTDLSFFGISTLHRSFTHFL